MDAVDVMEWLKSAKLQVNDLEKAEDQPDKAWWLSQCKHKFCSTCFVDHFKSLID